MTSLLIVDDDARMRSLIRSMVFDLVDFIAECGDGADAQTRYAEQHPDWVLMDLTMPKVNGVTATRQIKAYDPDARIIIVTGHVSPSLRDEALRAGAFAYVLKDNLLDLRSLLQVSAPSSTKAASTPK